MSISQQSQGGERIPPSEEFCDSLIIKASKSRASEVHIDFYESKFYIRFRVDGILELAGENPFEIYDTTIRKLKVLGQLNIAEVRLPQHGRGQLRDPATNTMIEFRVSTFPTTPGEAAVIHLINKQETVFENFESIGMSPDEAELMKDAIHKPYGMILVVGPAGSGKTATLYTALNQVRSIQKNVITLEDPVEFKLQFVRHAQIMPSVGFTFAEGMKAVLRQDPDVVFIGEILDHEIAEIAVRAALSGRLVFSSISTNDSMGTITRFLELGIPRSFLASTLLLTVSSRFLRKNCLQCVAPYVPADRFLKEAGLASADGIKFLKGGGCANCEQSGYLGRVPIFEFFPVDKEIAGLIVEGASVLELLQAAHVKGMKTMREAAVERAMAAETTLEEAIYSTA